MSFPAYPEYTDSGFQWLGPVPSSWSSVPFGMLFRRIKRTDHGDEELLSVYRDYGVIRKSDRDDNFNNASDDLSSYQLVEPGDLAMNKMKAWQGSLGVSDLRGIVSPAYFVFSPRKQFHLPFMHYLLRSPPYAAGYMMISKGIRINQWDVDPDHLTSLTVLFPSLAEQQAIAAFLDRETAKIDALVAEQERLIALLKEKRQAVISHAVTKGLDPDAPMKDSGTDWLDDIPAHWEPSTLRRCARLVQTGGTPSSVSPEENEEGVPWYTPGDFSSFALPLARKRTPEETVASGECRLFPEDSVLIIAIGGTLGKVGMPARECSSNQQINAVAPTESVAPKWLGYSLSAQFEFMRFISNASTIGIMNQEKTKDIPLAIPPLVEQERILNQLESELAGIERLVEEAIRAIQISKERRAALISAAVTGKIDVRGLVEQYEMQAA